MLTLPHRSAKYEETPRFLVIQNGARHNYAVPESFARVGALDALYTDFASNPLLRKFASAALGKEHRATEILERRTPPDLIAASVRTSDLAFIIEQISRNLPVGAGSVAAFSKKMKVRSMIRRGTGAATHIYTMLGEGGGFVQWAKDNGVGVVGDVYIALSADAIVNRERMDFPDWDDKHDGVIIQIDERQRNKVLLECSDLLVCPSAFVRDDLIENHGVDSARTCVIPYAVSNHLASLAPQPEPGRVLFAGSANLRKGIHYLAGAARLLKGICTVYVAGWASEKVRKHPEAHNLQFMGHLSKVRMLEEYARADVFVFPSLAEGSAGVTAEALGAGLPVVTTKAAGSIVRDGIDGLIVPERDPEALAEAICAIVEDRDKRRTMSQAARARAQGFTWDRFARQVIEATARIQR